MFIHAYIVHSQMTCTLMCCMFIHVHCTFTADMYPEMLHVYPCIHCTFTSLCIKRKGDGEGGIEKNGRGGLGRREGKGALAIKARIMLCCPHSKLIASSVIDLSCRNVY